MSDRSIKEFLKTPLGVVLVASVLTLLVAVESLYFILWSPFFIIYAALGITIPLFLGAHQFGSIKEVFRTKWKPILVLGIAIIVLDLILDAMYSLTLTALGVSTLPYYSLLAATLELATSAATKFGTSIIVIMVIYYIFVIGWAPIGEELLYRGYIFGELRKKSLPLALIGSSIFFGIRHATHFLFLLPSYPLVAAAYWAVSTFVVGLLFAYYYEKVQSLYPLIIIHFLGNVIEFLLLMQ